MTPRVGDDVHWFAEHGLYDGLFLMKDEETGTFWDHMTGRAVYGPLVGETLAVDAGLVHTTVAQVLRSSPDAMISLSDQAIRSDDQLCFAADLLHHDVGSPTDRCNDGLDLTSLLLQDI